MSALSSRRARRCGLVASLLGVVLSVAGPAAADTPGPDVGRERQRAAQLQRQEQQQAASAASAQARLTAVSAEANAALDAWMRARSTADDARVAAKAAERRAASAHARTEAARSRLDRYASLAYRAGPGGSQLGTLLSLVQGDPQEFVGGLALLGRVGDAESEVLQQLHAAEVDERDAAEKADAAAAAAATAATAAREAKQHADAVVTAQAQQLRIVSTQLARTRSALAASKQRVAVMERALRLAQEQARGGRVDATAAKCLGGSLDGYPNGRLPIAALCRLWGVGSEVLRKEAATAFNRMSHAYAKDFGVPICVRDAYRTYAEQVYLKETRGSYAAQPGTSEHGWGRAVDLCGGVETDGTATNTGMRIHAAQFGWFHPSWAERGAGGPYEPWHWEFAG